VVDDSVLSTEVQVPSAFELSKENMLRSVKAQPDERTEALARSNDELA
jgi:hypothetical protein